MAPNPNGGYTLAEVDGQMPKGFKQVPEHLNRAARRALRGRQQTTISGRSGGKLSKWARKQTTW